VFTSRGAVLVHTSDVCPSEMHNIPICAVVSFVISNNAERELSTCILA